MATPLSDALISRGASERRDRLAAVILFTCATVSLVIGALVIVSLLGEAMTFLRDVDPSALWSDGWFPRRGLFDVRTLLVGTSLVTAIAMTVAVPIGAGTAIYLSEFARPRTRHAIKPVIETMAGVPSVVIGFFALSWISPEIVARLNDEAQMFNLAAAGIGVGILTVPLVASVAEDALRAVPDEIRQASYALGASKARTCVGVVIPAAVSGLVAAMILAISRAIGETMVVLIAAGGAGGSLLSADPFSPGQTMTAAIASQTSGTDRVAGSGLTFQSLFFVGLLLFGITLGLNLTADRFVRRVREQY